MALDLTEVVRQALAQRAAPMSQMPRPQAPTPNISETAVSPEVVGTPLPGPNDQVDVGPKPTEASYSAPPQRDLGPEPLNPQVDEMRARPITIRQAEEASLGAGAPQPLGKFASQFAFGGQGPRSYTHSLRPERGKVVR